MDDGTVLAMLPMDTYLLFIPAGTPVDGAVVELARNDRRAVTAEVRIPAPKPEGHG